MRRSLTKESLLTLVHAFATSRVDHCNGLLFGSHSYLLDRLQSVLNSAARLVLNILNKFSHISAAIRDELHWKKKDRLQDRPYGPSLLDWCCAGVPDGTVPSCWLSCRSTVSSVGFSWWPRCSEVSASNIRPSGLRCLGPPQSSQFKRFNIENCQAFGIGQIFKNRNHSQWDRFTYNYRWPNLGTVFEDGSNISCISSLHENQIFTST